VTGFSGNRDFSPWDGGFQSHPPGGPQPFREYWPADPNAASARPRAIGPAGNPAQGANFRKIACLAETRKTALLGQLAHAEDTTPRWRYRQGRFLEVLVKWARYNLDVSGRTRAISVEICMNSVEIRR
jgi:hypothetical protein